MQLATERKVTRGRKLRTDGTVVESNIRPPSDSRLLADSVRVLARSVVRGQAILHSTGQKVQAGFEDLTQKAKRLAHQIGESLRSKKDAAQTAGRQSYQELLAMTEQTLAWAAQIEKQLQTQTQPRAKRLAGTPHPFCSPRQAGDPTSHPTGSAGRTSSCLRKDCEYL